jgi:integrase
MTQRTPSYRLHKPSGQAVVTLGGRDVYLGRYGSAQSRAEYDRVVAEWLAGGRRLSRPKEEPGDRLIVELILAFDEYAESRYPATSREPENYRLSLQPLRELYGHVRAGDFGPKALKAVQRRMVDLGWCRNVINRRIGRIKSFFKWCESEELVAPSTYHALQTVRGLPKAMPGVRETAPVEPAFWDEVKQVVPHCPRPVGAMLELQWLTAMRSGEVRVMRTLDLDVSRPDVWFYRPGSDAGPSGAHKNAWRGQDRVVALGPRAIAIVKEWLRPDDPGAYLFSPRQALKDLFERRKQERRSPRARKAGRRKARPKRRPGPRYSANSYAHAVSRACDKAKVKFHPYQLRHGRKMVVEAAADVDGARTVLGQRSIQSTQLYGRLDTRRAAEIMAQIG